MTVITSLRIPADEFELGRILSIPEGVSLKLESMIPLGQKAVPFIWVYNHGRDSFIESVRNHPFVDDFQVMEEYDDRTLYAIDWMVGQDLFFKGLEQTDAQLLTASGSDTAWEFELRFPDHEDLSAFREHCDNSNISIDVLRVYTPSRPEIGKNFGLSDAQRSALTFAVERGYYSLPRRCSTVEIAAELDISDQAVTERLRRGIETLVTNAIIDPTVKGD